MLCRCAPDEIIVILEFTNVILDDSAAIENCFKYLTKYFIVGRKGLSTNELAARACPARSITYRGWQPDN
jgi:hypothetical protein